MLRKNKLNRIAIAVAMSIGMSTVAMAQETSSGITGKVTGPQGNPAAGTIITITHVPSGSVKTAVVGSTGQFSAKGLRVGGPYRVSIDSTKFQDTTVNDVYLTLGESRNLPISLQIEQDVESILVTASQLSTVEFGSKGPTANFNLSDIQRAPAINRDITDLIRIDPRIYIDESRAEGVQCAGSSPRFNSLTLDGVKMNDNFGLNDNGYPTTRIPFSYDAIAQVAVELAPFDVQYGGFTACNINAVTKSGTNEVHGGVFYDFTSDSMRGDSLEGVDLPDSNFTEKRYGVNVGLPIIKDKLFLFASYEKLEGAELHEYPGISRVTDAELARITQISKDVYGYDPGGFRSTTPVEDEKLLVKLDWNISDEHRASLVYNYNDGFRISQSDDFSSAITYDGHFYEAGAEFESVVASVYSDWSSDFSTELRIASSKLDGRQTSLDADTGFSEVSINTPAGGTVFLGPDDSRQSNDLNYDTQNFKLAGTYYLGDHTLTGGIEYENLDIFNLFVQHTVGEYRFNNIDDFEAGLPDRIYYNNAAGSNDPDEVAASFSFQQTSLYVQDEWTFNDELTFLYGLRYDRYTSDDKPRFNQTFTDKFGFPNNDNLDGIDLLQPRFGFNWEASDNMEIRGGIGLYSGGNPNVWVSNAYSNDGVIQVAITDDRTPSRGPVRYDDTLDSLFVRDLTGAGNPIFDIPTSLFNEVAASDPNGAGGSGVSATDPNFKIPNEWKYSLGLTYLTEDEYVLTADFLYADKKDSAIIQDVGSAATGATAPDGRPINSGAEFQYLLTNVTGDDASSMSISFGLSKEYDNGLNVTASYAFTEAEDVNPMTSSVSGSNYGNIAVSNPNDPGLATSDYEIRHRFTLNLAYTTELFEGYETRFNLFGSANEGRPYSYSFSNDGLFGDSSFFSNGRQLIYIPEANDPTVVYGSITNRDGSVTPFDLTGFNQWITSQGLDEYRGSIMPRNSQRADWWIKFDLKIEQEFPGFMEGHNGSAFFVIENVGNMLNDDWGILRQGSFVSEAVVTASINDAGQYSYDGFIPPSVQTIQQDASTWEMRVGFNYKF
jgi:hypothetical protein